MVYSRFCTVALIGFSLLVITTETYAAPGTTREIGTDEALHNHCFFYGNSPDVCRESSPIPSENAPLEYIEVTDCFCKNGQATIHACQVQKSTYARDFNVDTLEWRYRAAFVEEDILGDASLCALCSPEMRVPDCTAIRSAQSGDGPTIADCRAGRVYQQSAEGILKQCFEAPVSDENPEWGTYCTSVVHIGATYPAPIREEHSPVQCCADLDEDDAGDGSCGEGNSHGNGYQDCDPNDDGVQRGCGLVAYGADLEFTDDYLDRLAHGGVDVEAFTKTTREIGILEDCSKRPRDDTNGDGVDVRHSYQCGYQDPPTSDPHHDTRFEFPLRELQTATEKGEVTCRIDVTPHSPGSGIGQVPLSDQAIQVHYKARRFNSIEFDVVKSDTIRLSDTSKCEPLSPGSSTLRCRADRLTIAAGLRGKHLTCQATPYVGPLSDYWTKRTTWALGMVVARRTAVAVPAYFDWKHPPGYQGTELFLDPSIDENCATAVAAAVGAHADSLDVQSTSSLGPFSITYEPPPPHLSSSSEVKRQMEYLEEFSESLRSPTWYQKNVLLDEETNRVAYGIPVESTIDLVVGCTIRSSEMVGENAGVRHWILKLEPTNVKAGLIPKAAIFKSMMAREMQRFYPLLGTRRHSDAADVIVFDTKGSTGMDFNNLYRQLPDYGVVRRSGNDMAADMMIKWGNPLIHAQHSPRHLGFTPLSSRNLVFIASDASEETTLSHEFGHIYGLCDEYSADAYDRQDRAIGCPNKLPKTCIENYAGLCRGMPHSADRNVALPNAESAPYYSIMGEHEGVNSTYPQTNESYCGLRARKQGTCHLGGN